MPRGEPGHRQESHTFCPPSGRHHQHGRHRALWGCGRHLYRSDEWDCARLGPDCYCQVRMWQRGFKSAWAKDLILDFSPPPHKYSETCAQKNVFKYSQSHGFCLFHITDKNDVTIIMFLTINLTVNWVFLIKVGNRRHFDRLWFVLLLSERVFPSVWQPPWPVSELPVSPVPDLWRCFWSSRRLGCPLRTSASWSLSTGCCKFNVNTNDIFKTYRNSLI